MGTSTMDELIVLAQTYEELRQKARMQEITGWVLGVLAFCILFLGVYLEIRKAKKKKAEQKDAENQPE